MKTDILRIVAAVFFMPLSAFAQPPARPISPEVQPDGHVIFRLAAPNAVKVEIQIEGQPSHATLRKDEHGIWSATVGPLPPDIYSYSFLSDGVSLMDPSNPRLKPNLLDPESAVHVPGPPSLPWELNQVPHGEIHHHFYHSQIAGDDRDFYVYTPPDYRTQPKHQYPVLYLLHGFSDDASGWTSVGLANVILDNLSAQGKTKPMIVVMPLGYGDFEVVRRGWGYRSDKELARRNLSKFTDTLLKEVMPQVEQSYRIKKDRDSRAIAGLSMGGTESLRTGLNHLDQFAWIGAFSSGGLDVEDFNTEFPNLDASAKEKLRLLWIACGTEDDLIKLNREFKSWLKEKSVPFTDIETLGMHAWLVWRRNLASFAPLLFQ